ncbi:MAG: flagellar basal body protein [Planctomycetota bacterium]|jgi:flagellar basal-body rod protein FlgC|nr:flagellar basal body protein [Planctomycetota bacterium]
MSVNALRTPRTAIETNQLRLDVSANNVANLNTDGFRASQTATEDRAYINSLGTGVQTAATYAPARPAAPAPTSASPSPAEIEPSNTDLAVELTNQMNFRNAYSANLVQGRTETEVSQTLMDLVG